MKVLDLFAGLEGWSAPWRERGHDVFSVDLDERFPVDLYADILTLEPADLPWKPDVVLASPPCEKFSVLTFGQAWLPGYVPKHSGTVLAMDLVRATVRLIAQLKPAFWVVENPVGMLRKLHLLPYERQTVTYCQYGGSFRKPTDLWGGFPPSLVFRRRCKNYDRCHISSPRGSTTGIQGDGAAKVRLKDGTRVLVEKPHKATRRGSLELNKAAAREHYGTSNMRDLAALRAKIPEELSLDVCLAAERDHSAGIRASDYTGRLFA